MQVDRIKNMLLFGIPTNSIALNNLFSITDPSLSFEYFIVYKQEYKQSVKDIFDQTKIDLTPIKGPYILPLFSCAKMLYYIYKEDNNFVFDYTVPHFEMIDYIPAPEKNSLFYNMDVHPFEFENMILSMSSNNLSLIKYLAEHFTFS